MPHVRGAAALPRCLAPLLWPRLRAQAGDARKAGEVERWVSKVVIGELLAAALAGAGAGAVAVPRERRGGRLVQVSLRVCD